MKLKLKIDNKRSGIGRSMKVLFTFQQQIETFDKGRLTQAWIEPGKKYSVQARRPNQETKPIRRFIFSDDDIY